MHPATTLLAILTTATIVAGAPARAGTYDVVSCGDALGHENHAWVSSNSAPGSLTISAVCPPDPADPYSGLAVFDTNPSPDIGAGAMAEWTFTAPAGTEITRWRYARWLGEDSDAGWKAYVKRGDGLVLDTCDILYPATRCDVGGVPSSFDSRRDVAGLSQTSLVIGLACGTTDGSNCVTGAAVHRAWASLYASTVTLSESTTPTVGFPAGDLATGADWHHGAEAVAFTAADGVGVKQTRVYVDGVLRSSQTAPAGDPSSGSEWECDFTYAKPCSDPPGPVAHTIDTRVLADGTRQVQVAAVDAAGNEALSAPVSVKVDNGAPAAQVVAPGGTQAAAAVPMSWSGWDGAGSGIDSYDVEVSVDGGAWQPWLNSTPGTSATYSGVAGASYSVRVRARDRVGHVGGWVVSATTRVEASPLEDPVQPVNPVGPGNEGAKTSRASRKSPRITLRSVRRRSGRLFVIGTVPRAATGTIRVTWAAKRRSRWLRVSRSAALRAGRFHATLRLHPGPSRGGERLTLRYGGDERYASRVVRARIGA